MCPPLVKECSETDSFHIESDSVYIQRCSEGEIGSWAAPLTLAGHFSEYIKVVIYLLAF